MTFADVFVQVLHSSYQNTGFNIDVAIEFLAQVGIVWNEEPVSFLSGTRFSTVLPSRLR